MPSTPRPRPPRLASPIPVSPSSVRIKTTIRAYGYPGPSATGSASISVIFIDVSSPSCRNSFRHAGRAQPGVEVGVGDVHPGQPFPHHLELPRLDGVEIDRVVADDDLLDPLVEFVAAGLIRGRQRFVVRRIEFVVLPTIAEVSD